MKFVNEKAKSIWDRYVPDRGVAAVKQYKKCTTAVGRYGTAAKKLSKRIDELIDSVPAHFPDAKPAEHRRTVKMLEALKDDLKAVAAESKSLKGFYKMCQEEMEDLTEWMESLAK